jgi:integrase
MIANMRLYKRNGIWYVEFRRAKKRSLRTRDKKQAQRIFRELRSEWLKGRLVELDSTPRTTLEEYAKDFIESRQGMSPHTLLHDRVSLALLKDVLGGSVPLKLVTSRKIDDFKKACLARGVKPQSINSYLGHIKAAFSTAVEWRLIKQNPRIKMLPADKPLPRVLTPEEIDKLLEHSRKTNTELWRLLVFYLWTGCRRAEALRLTWQNCHLKEGNYYAILRKTKGKRDRVVPLLPEVLEVLLPLKKDIGPVFIQVHPDTITHWFKALAHECGIDAHLHEIRHTSATYMIASGISLRSVQEVLGHSQFSTTQIYTHLVKDQLGKEMEKLRFEW